MEKDEKRAYIKYISALLLFGSNGIVASHIALNSYEIVLLRTAIGSAFLFLLFLLMAETGCSYMKPFSRLA